MGPGARGTGGPKEYIPGFSNCADEGVTVIDVFATPAVVKEAPVPVVVTPGCIIVVAPVSVPDTGGLARAADIGSLLPAPIPVPCSLLPKEVVVQGGG